eukprot:5205518-Pyramimonas_sp.AAC.1
MSNNLKLERKSVAENGYTLMAASGQTFGNSRLGSVPAWIPARAAAQPPARRGPFFQYLEPLKRRFIKWIAHLAERQRVRAPPIAEWWPLLWATEIDLYARPFSCPALAAFDWPEAPDSYISHDDGWDEWERSMQ